jgi:diguanylate cyclase (GGDEF)-like protein
METERPLLRRLRQALPSGGSLPKEVWFRRHHGIVALLWLQSIGIAIFGVVRGAEIAHSIAEAMIVAVAAAGASWSSRSRLFRSSVATLGLVTTSAILVHLSGGSIEMHFHFFVMVGVITLYQDWVPFLLALSYVVAHHGVMGVIEPSSVYNHPAAWNSPWRWALIHGVFILGASAAHLTAWRLNERGFQDSLTSLANRSLFEDRVAKALARSNGGDEDVAVLFLDVDDFKTVNDSLGHTAGDRLLVSVAERVRTCLRGTDTAARLGGDEFGVLLQGDDARRAAVVAERLLEAFRQPFTVQGREIFTTVSIGVATNRGNQKATDLLRNADAAMYVAKRNGKARQERFESNMHAAVLARLDMQAELQRAIQRSELVLHFQPIVELTTSRIVSMEALIRWQHPTRGLLPPMEFIPLAEETGLIVQIGEWVILEACRQIQTWNRQFPDEPPLQLSINLSARQLQEVGVDEFIAEAIRRSRLRASDVTLEITESVLMQDPESAIEILRSLRRLGLQVAIDDFGIGYSSFAYLQRLPVDMLKIDKSFIAGLTQGARESALAHAMINVGLTLGLEITAEGIEESDQVTALREMQCQFGQGFLFSKPADAEVMTDLLAVRPRQGRSSSPRYRVREGLSSR